MGKSFNLTWLSDFFCDIAKELKKKARASTKNKRNIFTLALLMRTGKRIRQHKVRKPFERFFYIVLERGNTR